MSFEFTKNVHCDGSGYPYAGGADAYEREIRALLTTINGTATGKTLLSFFALRQRSVTIRPLNQSSNENHDVQSPGKPNASSTWDGNQVDAFRRLHPLRDLKGRADPDFGTGTGKGTDSIVSFTPLYFSQTPDAEPDAVLVHELFHSMRVVFGMQERRPLGPDFRNAEEMYCIFVENMYRQEKGYTLRMTHRHQAMTPDHRMANNPMFHEPMRRISGMMPTIVGELAKVDIVYNPFKDWLAYNKTHPQAGLVAVGVPSN